MQQSKRHAVALGQGTGSARGAEETRAGKVGQGTQCGAKETSAGKAGQKTISAADDKAFLMRQVKKIVAVWLMMMFRSWSLQQNHHHHTRGTIFGVPRWTVPLDRYRILHRTYRRFIR